MYLHHLSIQNMKRLHHFELDFRNADGAPRMWTVLIGENGTAKTTILQAIALASAGRMWVNDLGKDVVPALMTKRGKMEINAKFGFGEVWATPEFHPLAGEANLRTLSFKGFQMDRGVNLVSRVNLDADTASFSAFDQYDHPRLSTKMEASAVLTPLERARAKNTPHWFVAAYGVHRGLPRAGESPDITRPGIDRLRPFFDPMRPLTSINFIDIFGPRSGNGKRFEAALNKVMIGTGLLPDDVKRIELRGWSGARRARQMPFRNSFHQAMGGRTEQVPMSGVAHGMQSTLAWVADVVGHVIYEAEEHVEARDMEGVVLIDEIDAFLHPVWQVKIIDGLRKVFPRMQFIVSAHSPGVLSSFQPGEIVQLMVDSNTGSVVRDKHPQPDPRMLTGSELYEDYFRISRATLYRYGAALRETYALMKKRNRTAYENERLALLKAQLTDQLGSTLLPQVPPSEDPLAFLDEIASSVPEAEERVR